MLKFVLLILDGYGLRAEREGNATILARTPALDRLLGDSPMIELQASGEAVGLPEGVMGNSEVGHMNMGAGRIVRQDLVRINAAIASGEFQHNAVLLEQLAAVRQRGGAFHVLGLCSDAGVHSNLEHLKVILETARASGVERVYYHALVDGRDTAPSAGAGYLDRVEAWLAEIGVGRIATVVGRYYAMDRDHHWERIELAWRMFTLGAGERVGSAAGKAADNFIVVHAPYFVGGMFHDRIAESDLAVTADRNFTVLPNGKNGGAMHVELFRHVLSLD